MDLSQRIALLNPSPTVALNAKAKELQAAGKDILNFAVGEPDFATPQPIIDKTIAALQAGKTKYGPAGGGPAIRQAVVDKLRRENNLSFEASDVVCGIGAKELLFHLSLSLLNEGDEVLIPAPYWVSYADQIKAAGAVPVVVPTSDINRFPIDVAALKRATTAKTKAIIINTPNNPAGYVLSADQTKGLTDFLKDKPWWIISDEMYEYLAFDSEHISPLQVEPTLRDRFILVHGLSKGFAMTGFRVGYTVGPSAAMKFVRGLQSHSSTCLPPFIEEAATFALNQGRDLMVREIELLKGRRDLAVSELDKISGIGYVRPAGAFYAFIDLRDALAGSKFGPDNTMAFCEHLLLEHHIAVVPGEAFGTPGYLRLSYATGDEIIIEGISRLAVALKTLG